jgi:hypothetical protein
MNSSNHAHYRLGEIREMLCRVVIVLRHAGLPVVGWLEGANRRCLILTLADRRQVLVEPLEVAAVSLFVRRPPIEPCGRGWLREHHLVARRPDA